MTLVKSLYVTWTRVQCVRYFPEVTNGILDMVK